MEVDSVGVSDSSCDVFIAASSAPFNVPDTMTSSFQVPSITFPVDLKILRPENRF